MSTSGAASQPPEGRKTSCRQQHTPFGQLLSADLQFTSHSSESQTRRLPMPASTIVTTASNTSRLLDHSILQRQVHACSPGQHGSLTHPSLPQNTLSSRARGLQNTGSSSLGSLESNFQTGSPAPSSRAREAGPSAGIQVQERWINRRRTPPRRRNHTADAQELARLLQSSSKSG